MKLSVAYVKKNPVLFGVIIVVFGLGIWLLLNRNSSGSVGSSGGTTVVNAGPSDAQIAAATATQIAQIQAGTAAQAGQYQLAALDRQGDIAVTLATLDAQYKANELAATRDVANNSLIANVTMNRDQLDNSRAIVDSNNAFMLGYAATQANAATQQLQIGAGLQRDLSAQQADAYKFSTLASLIGSAKKASVKGPGIQGLLSDYTSGGMIPGQTSSGAHI